MANGPPNDPAKDASGKPQKGSPGKSPPQPPVKGVAGRVTPSNAPGAAAVPFNKGKTTPLSKAAAAEVRAVGPVKTATSAPVARKSVDAKTVGTLAATTAPELTNLPKQPVQGPTPPVGGPGTGLRTFTLTPGTPVVTRTAELQVAGLAK